MSAYKQGGEPWVRSEGEAPMNCNQPGGKHLAAILSSILAMVPAAHASDVRAAVISVSNCNDSGTGSLRNAIAGANSGDTINLQSVACPRILLTSGAIAVPQNDLTLLGRGTATLIDGNRASSVFRHSGTGTLTIRNLSVGYGHFRSSNAQGGCIGSEGNVVLRNARVHHCIADGDRGLDPQSAGGGVFAEGNVTVVDSHVYANSAIADSNNVGGGIIANGRLTVNRSRIFDNSAPHGFVGGAAAWDGLLVLYSEISGNQAMSEAGIWAYGDSTVSHSSIVRNRALLSYGGATLVGDNGDELLVIDSTISDNSAQDHSGLSMRGDTAIKSVVNSTIAYNREYTQQGPVPSECHGALAMTGLLHLDSSIVARNRCDDRPADIVDTPEFAQLQGADNLIEVSTLPVPAGTISANPRLALLAYHGGPTRTRTLMVGSPAIDMGNNVAELAFDQRGPGFPRVKGARADIGAYEY